MSAPKKIRVPGKIMLSGEYAVLFGERSLAFAIDRHMDVYVSESSDECFHVSTDLWNEELVFKSFDEVPEDKKKTPLIRALQVSQQAFSNTALKIEIRSQMDASAGMGTSSAVILGCTIASSLFAKNTVTTSPMKLAYQVQKDIQGNASGYDVLTQSVGALVAMKPDEEWPGHYEQITDVEASFYKFIHLFAGGKGSATGPLLQETLNAFHDEKMRAHLLKLSSRLTGAFIHFLKTEENFEILVDAVREHREFFSEFPHFPKDLCNALKEIPGCDQRWTFKTTGAGGEDSLLFIGDYEDLRPVREFMTAKKWYELNCSFHEEGAKVESHDL